MTPALESILPDQSQYDNYTAKHPGSPSWIFSDDQREPMTAEEAWFHHLCLDYEEDIRQHLTSSINEKDEEKIAYWTDKMEQLRSDNWLVKFHKRRPENNDKWHGVLSVLAENAEVDPSVPEIYRAIKEELKYGPRPIGGTTFANPDGSKYTTMGTAIGSAKAAFKKRHGIEDEFITCDRVQYVTEKVMPDGKIVDIEEPRSKWVVGTRRVSNRTPSNYYDPTYIIEPDDNDKPYIPRNCALVKVPESKCFMGYRLTIRELEQALIQGAELYDNIDDISTEELTEPWEDYRELSIDAGYGKQARTHSVLTHQEAYLYEAFQKLASQDDDDENGHSRYDSWAKGNPVFEQAAELLTRRYQNNGTLSVHFMSCGNWSKHMLALIHFVKNDEQLKEEDEANGTNYSQEILDYIRHEIFRTADIGGQEMKQTIPVYDGDLSDLQPESEED